MSHRNSFNRKMKNHNRSRRKRRHYTATSCKNMIEALRVPDYDDRISCDQIHFTNIDPLEERTYGLTTHAKLRMSQRGISKDAMAVVLQYGRRVHGQNCIVYFFGKKEFKRHLHSKQNAGKWADFRDIHVIVSPNDSTIITTYKNQKITMKADF